MKLLIVGAGEYGQLVREIAELTGKYNQIDYLDDNYIDAVGKIDDLKVKQEEYDGCIVAIGNPDIREKVFSELEIPITLIHPKAIISKGAVIGMGCVIEANVVVNTNATIGNCSYICAGAVVNHNATVGEFCQVDCNAVVAAGSILAKGEKLGSCLEYKGK